MKTVSQISELRTQVKVWRQQGLTVAFVPTMGNLHAGHISLVDEAHKHADKVVASIFINPMQFGVNEDIDNYPRTMVDDQQKLTAAGTDLLFTPTPDIIYPKGLAKQSFIEVPNISDGYCGESRPGHFRGVATVVCKLFNLVQPDIACFGLKDYQQVQVIQTMVEDLSMPITIIPVATTREESGLALSSRNGYLTAEEKAIAPVLQKKAQVSRLLLRLLSCNTFGAMVKKGTSSHSAGTLKSPTSVTATSKPDKDKDAETEKKGLPNKSHKGGALRQFLSKRDLKILKQAKLQGGAAWEAAKAKVRLKLTPAEYKSKSARANTAMPVKKLKRRLQDSVPKNRRVTTEAGVALAAVLDYAVSELVDNACQAAELKRARTIIPRHIKLGVPQDESLAELFRGVTIPQGGTVPTFHPELAQGYKRRATRPRPETTSKELSSPGYGNSKNKKDLSEAKPGSSGEETSHDHKKDKPGASSSSPAEK